MANIIGRITVNEKDILEVDSDPSAGGGTAAPIGSEALLNNGGVGQMYLKIGAADTAWDAVSTATTSGVKQGAYLHIPIYDTNASGYSIDDVVQQNSQDISLDIVAQPGRTAAITYHVPNPGNSVTSADFVLTQGAQTISGVKTFQDNAIFNANLTVNGTLTYLNSTNTDITDKNITLNKGGAAASAGGSGLSFEENSVITGYFQVAADRNGYELLAPNVAFKNDLDLSNLTANHVQHFADTDGTFVMRPDATPGVAGQVAFWQDANNLISESNLFWDSANNRLGIATNAPSANLHVVGSVRFASIVGPNKFLKVDANGNVSAAAVDLTADVTGVLPIANGGTNSSTALNNNRLMYSSGGAIVEYSALQPNQVYFGAATTGLPAQSANLWWDIANSRLGIGNSAPTRVLDVTGDALITGKLKVDNASKANYELRQAEVQTTDATATTVQTIAVPTDSEILVEARVLGRRASNGNSAAYVRTARFKNVGGTVTIHNLQTDYTSEDVGAWNATLIASGTNAIVQVVGAASSTIDWAVTSIVQIMQ